MKKLILLSLSGLLVLVLFNKPKATAQNFHIVASFGTTHAWNVPAAIEFEIYDYYPYHNWVHVNRVVRGRRIFYNILLERDGFYTELQFGRYSRLLRTQFYADYPLYNHFCSGHCGYHSAYFNSHRVVNNHYYYGGHNHFVYRPQPRHYTAPVRPQRVHYTEYGNRNRNNRVVYNDTRVARSNSSGNRSEPVRVNNNSRSNHNRSAVSSRSTVNRSVRSTSSNDARTVRSTTSNARVERAPQSRSTRTINSAPAKRESREVSRSTSSRSTGSSVASNRKASSPAVSNNSRSSTSRSAASTSRSSSSSTSRGRGN